MKSRRPLLVIIFTLIVLQTGCSAENSSQSQKDINQPVAKKEQAKASGKYYVLGGMTKEQGETFVKALQKADVDMAPILKGRQLEKENPALAVTHYQEILRTGRYEVEAHLGLSRSYETLGNYSQAAEQLQLALPLINDWAKPEYEKRLSELKVKAAQQIPPQ